MLAGEGFGRLIEIMARLRGPGGCPWDREQTHESLKPFLVEETYEVLEAIDEGLPGKVREELGDLLFQVVFHARLAEERGEYDMDGVIETIAEKMTRRHPHVFGDKRLETSAEVLVDWETMKKGEPGYTTRESILDGVPRELPALIRAHRLQERAARVGFDWERLDDVNAKLDEEVGEFKAALASGGQTDMEDELGDIFFALVNIARFTGINPEDALRKTISKFISRFKRIEELAAAQDRELAGMTLSEMDALWEKAKQEGP